MAARLGKVLFSGLAVLIVGLTSYFISDDWLSGRVFDETEILLIGVTVALAVVAWLIGRACRYVLAGKFRTR